MRKLLSLKRILFIALVVCMQTSLSLQAQEPHGSELYKTLQSRDSLLFNVGFNTCDISQFENLVSDSFEFYHDKGGITPNKTAFVESIKNGVCKMDYKAMRQLVAGTLEVFPLYKSNVLYGAIQMGEHRFYATEKDKAPYFTSYARFTHLWLLENGIWKLKRGLSYDHQTADKAGNSHTAIFDNDDAINAWLKANNIHTLGIGLIEGGQLQQVKLYGELKKGSPAPYNTIFNVASLAKTITNLVTLKLVSNGQWKLDEPLDKYWVDPDLANDPRYHQLTTRSVLTHRTGFPNWRYMNNGKLAFQFDPNTKYQYSGEGFEYLRHALEKKFHKPLEKLADSLIFKPLGLTDSRFIWDEAKVNARFAIGYNAKNEAYENNRNTKANAADDLLTTIEDYGKFLVYVMNGAGLSADVYGEMTKQQTTVKEHKYFGLGWELYDFGKGEYALAHGGADKGVAAEVIILPKSKKGLLIFTNADEGYKVYEQLIRHYLGEEGEQLLRIEMEK